MDELATFLRTARENAKLTQADLARKMGYTTPQFISNLECRRAPLPLNKVKPFIRLTKCNPDLLRKAIVSRFNDSIASHFPKK